MVSTSIFFYQFFICLFIYVHMCQSMFMGRSENRLQELILSSHHMGPGMEWAIGLGSKCFYPLSCLDGHCDRVVLKTNSRFFLACLLLFSYSLSSVCHLQLQSQLLFQALLLPWCLTPGDCGVGKQMKAVFLDWFNLRWLLKQTCSYPLHFYDPVFSGTSICLKLLKWRAQEEGALSCLSPSFDTFEDRSKSHKYVDCGQCSEYLISQSRLGRI